MAACSYLDQVRLGYRPATIGGCDECLRSGSDWVHLRLRPDVRHDHVLRFVASQACKRHAAEEGHPTVRLVEPGEDCRWCYVDQLMFQLAAT